MTVGKMPGLFPASRKVFEILRIDPRKKQHGTNWAKDTRVDIDNLMPDTYKF